MTARTDQRLRSLIAANGIDNSRSRTALCVIENPHLAAGRSNAVITGDLLRSVIAPLDEDIRLQTTDQTFRCVLAKSDDPVDIFQRRYYTHALLKRIDRPPGPLQCRYRCIIIDRYYQTITKPTCLFKVDDMAGMKNVETAIGHDNAFTLGAQTLHQLIQGILFNDTMSDTRFLVIMRIDHRAQFADGHGYGAEFADSDASSLIGQCHRVRQGLTGGQDRGQDRYHRITGTGDVKDLAGPGGKMLNRLPPLYQ